jgi:hypothetical protein
MEAKNAKKENNNENTDPNKAKYTPRSKKTK